MLGWAAGLMFTPLAVQAEESPLAAQMEVVGGAVKSLRNETDSAKGSATAREAQDAVLKAIPMLPATVTRLTDAAAKAKAAADYRHMLGKLYVAFCEVEQAYLSNDAAKITAAKNALQALKKEGHAKFMDDED